MKRFSQILLLSLSVVLFNSCAVIEGIFKAGMWTGILVVVVVTAAIIWIFAKLFGGRRQ